MDRRSFLRLSAPSIGTGALLQFTPANAALSHFARPNGEPPPPFSFMQLSDTHVGFNGPPDPLGTKAFESAVATINALKTRPEPITVTGDLTHDADAPAAQAKRFKLFKETSSKVGR